MIQKFDKFKKKLFLNWNKIAESLVPSFLNFKVQNLVIFFQILVLKKGDHFQHYQNKLNLIKYDP